MRERLGIDELIYVRIQEDDRMSPKKAYLPYHPQPRKVIITIEVQVSLMGDTIRKHP